MSIKYTISNITQCLDMIQVSNNSIYQLQRINKSRHFFVSLPLLHNDSIQLLPLWVVLGMMRAIAQETTLELGVIFQFGRITINCLLPFITQTLSLILCQ